MGRLSTSQGAGSAYHNKRAYGERKWPENIDRSRTPDNVVLIDRDLKEVYEEIFGSAVSQYNEKQRRADRRVKDYLQHVKKSKNGEKPFYEVVCQWGRKEDFEVNPQLREVVKNALVKYASEFQARNPNLVVVGAYVHMDEASPHLHLDYVPVAHGFKKGIAVRNSLNKALREQGIEVDSEVSSRKNNVATSWSRRERLALGEVCREFGLVVEEESRSRGSLSVVEYKRVRDEMRQEILGSLLKEKKTLEEENAVIRAKSEKIRAENRDFVSKVTEKVSSNMSIDDDSKTKGQDLVFGVGISKKRFAEYETKRQAYNALRPRYEQLDREVREWRGREQKLSDKEKRLKKQEQDLADQQTVIEYQQEVLSDPWKYYNDALTARDEVVSENQNLVKQKNGLEKENQELRKSLRAAFEVTAEIVEAVAEMKYGGDQDDFAVKLPEKASLVVDAVAVYGCKRAKEFGFEDLGEKMSNLYGVSKGVKAEFDKLLPARERKKGLGLGN